MQEPNNDRLEQFFRKAASRADVTFNEDDWKKLEARLDAREAGRSGNRNKGKIAGAIVIALTLLTSGVLWMHDRYELLRVADAEEASVADEQRATSGLSDGEHQPASDILQNQKDSELLAKDNVSAEAGRPAERPAIDPVEAETDSRHTIVPDDLQQQLDVIAVPSAPGAGQLPAALADEKIDRELVRMSPAIAQRNKQKAVVELPGAEEGKTREVESMVDEEHASDQVNHVATPRLSLLLSFAPDFSGTSLGLYSAPGKAYGAMLHYHLLDRWSISAGVIKNQKEYTGDGEDYKPPKGYWKYYTNGIIPETIDGSCSILEFPLMIQYTLYHSGKNKWTAATGLSSYLMQTESYIYNFDQPNPGARERWDSRGSSRFMFNMIDFSIGYERQVLPGLMLGLEPYAKIPLEEIGWCNLRLFSTGASVTLRYTVLRKNKPFLPEKSRAPD